jgi:co-chaperonin GroES (HSP10)
MRRISSVLFVALLLVSGGLLSPLLAQDKSARGTITAIGADSVTIKTADREMKFMVDAKTVLTASGAGTAARKATASGKPGLNLTDYVKTGDTVEVAYQESGGTMRATSIRPTAGASPTSSASGAKSETANGTVDSINKATLTISGTIGGGGSFKQSYSIDANTRVVAEGAGTASAKQQGKVSLTDFVGVGDQVTVTYRSTASGLHADEVRVRAKKK